MPFYSSQEWKGILAVKHSLVRFLLISLAAVAIAAAQTTNDTAPPAQVQHTVDPQRQLNHLTKKLALTADQQNQILPLLTDRQQQIAAIMNDTTLDKKQRHAKMTAVRSDSESKIRNVLTDTQRTAYDQMQQEARERARERKQTTVQ